MCFIYMCRAGLFSLRTEVEWWAAVLNSKPPTGTNLCTQSSVIGQKTQEKEHCRGKKRKHALSEGDRKDTGT